MNTKINWEEKGPMIVERLGKMTSAQIATEVDVHVYNVRSYCARNKLSMKLTDPLPFNERPLSSEPIYKVDTALPVLSVDPNKLWKIPSIVSRVAQ